MGVGKLWSDKMLDFLRFECHMMTYVETASAINARFGTSLRPSQIKSCRGNRKISSGLTGHFPKGHVPANKGKKTGSRGRMAETQFKKGHMPQTYRPVGTEQLRGDGYVWVKIKDPRTWRQKHVLVWERHHGPVPRGHVVLFADSNRQNFNIDNLILVSRAQLVRMNQNGLISQDPELTRMGVTVSELMTVTGQAAKKVKKEV